jgi:EAL and modified HD-GYP domain-containing signal transduction protein
LASRKSWISPIAGRLCVARQPIFGTAGDVAGYELLYGRISSNEAAGGVDRSVLSADVLVRAVIDIGLDQLTGRPVCFMNFTREMLLARAYRLVSPESVVIELLDTVKPDETSKRHARSSWTPGYSLALDDFVWDQGYRRLLELATIVKVDVLEPAGRRVSTRSRSGSPYTTFVCWPIVWRLPTCAPCALGWGTNCSRAPTTPAPRW